MLAFEVEHNKKIYPRRFRPGLHSRGWAQECDSARTGDACAPMRETMSEYETARTWTGSRGKSVAASSGRLSRRRPVGEANAAAAAFPLDVRHGR